MADQKQCPACKMMIPKNARVCAYCRRKQPARLWVKVGFGALFFIGIMTIVASNQSQQPAKAVPKAASEIHLTGQGQKIKAQHPSWGNGFCDSIAKKEIAIGMNKEQVTAAWGNPAHLNSLSTGASDQEVWWYGRGIHTMGLHFQDDTLVEVMENK